MTNVQRGSRKITTRVVGEPPEAYSSDSSRDASNGQLDHRSVRRNSRIGRINAEGASYSPIPALVRSLQGLDIVNVVAGWGHSAVVTRDGDIYICGRHVKGQLGLGDRKFSPRMNEATRLSRLPQNRVYVARRIDILRRRTYCNFV